MKRLFRSIINVCSEGKATIPPEELVRNYKAFLQSKVNPEDPSYVKLYTWIEAHYRQYKELPSLEYLFEKAKYDGDEAVMAGLRDIAAQTAFTKSDYRAILHEKFETQNIEEFRALVEKSWKVASTGLKIGKKKEIRGLSSALEYFMAESRKFRMNTFGIKVDSQIRSKEDYDEVMTDYKKRKKDPLTNLGLFTFLDKMDDAFRGIKLGELFIVAAYVAQGKTTFVINMAYNGIIQGLNGLYMTLEMPFKEIRDLFYTMHTTYPEWYDHAKFSKLTGKVSFERVCYGELSDLEQEFFEAASEDFVTRPDFGELLLKQPTGPLTPSILDMELYDAEAYFAEKGKKLDFIIVDYVGLMIQDKNERYGDFNIDLNNMIKKLKNTAINFSNGRGLRVITPFQVNRNGYKEAIKNDGIYTLTALSNANEADRSSDGVISLFMTDEMKKSGRMKVCCLKHRDGPDFSPHEINIDFTSRKIRDFIQKKQDSAPDDDMFINEIPLDI